MDGKKKEDKSTHAAATPATKAASESKTKAKSALELLEEDDEFEVWQLKDSLRYIVIIVFVNILGNTFLQIFHF